MPCPTWPSPALAALAFGVDLRVGLYGGCIAFALVTAALGRRSGADDTVIGSVFAWVLGLGALFLSLYTTSSSGSGGAGGDAGVNVLFGSILGLSGGEVIADVLVALAVVAGMVALARPWSLPASTRQWPPPAACRCGPWRTGSSSSWG